jgi:NDP-sugar pyrophosphorylase family protein
MQGTVQVEPDCTIENSTIGPNVYIGRNVSVADSEVCGSVIMDNCVIRNSVVADSVIGPGTRIEGEFSKAVCGPKSLISFR